MEFEYGIIGGGPAGYTTAMALAQKGHSVVLFEKDKLGGTCLNKGCIPTKSLLHSSELYKDILQADNIGLDIEIKSFKIFFFSWHGFILILLYYTTIYINSLMLMK